MPFLLFLWSVQSIPCILQSPPWPGIGLQSSLLCVLWFLLGPWFVFRLLWRCCIRGCCILVPFSLLPRLCWGWFWNFHRFFQVFLWSILLQLLLFLFWVWFGFPDTPSSQFACLVLFPSYMLGWIWGVLPSLLFLLLLCIHLVLSVLTFLVPMVLFSMCLIVSFLLPYNFPLQLFLC